MSRLQEQLGPKAMHEFLQSQVEIGTEVCGTVGEARTELIALRKTVADGGWPRQSEPRYHDRSPVRSDGSKKSR
jgi:hypothetical protein